MTASLSVGILGLGRIGTSVGLALKRYSESGKYQFQIAGYDSVTNHGKDAQKAGAIDSIARQAHACVEGADIVVLALPYDEMEETYERIGTDVRDGAVILDFSLQKQSSIEWTKKYLKTDGHLVGCTAIVNPKYLYDNTNSIDGAVSDLFDDGTILLSPSVNCAKEAIELAVNFSSILGADHHFVDIGEADSLNTLTEILPGVLSLALFRNLLSNPGWSDLQRQINPATGSYVQVLHDFHPDTLRDLWLQNPEYLVRIIDSYQEQLQGIRDLIIAKDEAAIEAMTVQTTGEYEQWINRRNKRKWEASDTDRLKPHSSLLGGFISNRLFGGSDDE